MPTYYVIKHKEKELYLPWRKGSNSKAELCEPKEGAPRVFHSYKGAKQAMLSWLKGVQRGHGNWEGPDDPYASGGAYFVLDSISIRPQKHRKAEDVHVVEWRVVECEIS